MITIEQKIEQFRRMVLGHAQHALEEKVSKLDQSDLLAMETMKQELESLGNKHIEEHVHLALLDRKRQLAQAKLHKTHSLLRVKHQFVESVLEELKVKAREVTLKEGYREIVLNDVQSVTAQLSDEDSLRIFVTAEMMSWQAEFEKLLSRFKKVEILESDQDLIGGVILESSLAGERYDMSYLSRIVHSEALKGGRVFEILNEEVKDHA